MSAGPSRNDAGVAVEHRAEDARRVEARQAHPLDVAARRDQRADLAVRQERVVGDRRERAAAEGDVADDVAHGARTLACQHGHDEQCDRSLPAAEGRRGQGSRLDALRRRPAGPRACCTRGSCWPPRRTGGSRASTASAALDVPGVVAVLTAADLPIVDGAAGRAGQPLARSEVVFSGQPVALVVAETEAAATDGVDAVVVDDRAAEAAVLDLEAAMAPDAPLARVEVGRGRRRRRRRRARRGGRRRRGRRRRGAVGQRRRAPADGRRRRGRGAGRRRRARGRDASARAGSTRATWSRRSPPRGSSPRASSSCSSSTQGAFSTRQQLADLLGWPHDRVRVRPAPLGGAFGGKLMIAEPLVAAAAVRLEPAGAAGADAHRGLRRVQPGARRASSSSRRAPRADGRLTARARPRRARPRQPTTSSASRRSPRCWRRARIAGRRATSPPTAC